MTNLVRYQVLDECFVNDTLIRKPQAGKDVFVLAVPGLEGGALKLAPDEAAPPVAAASPAAPAEPDQPAPDQPAPQLRGDKKPLVPSKG